MSFMKYVIASLLVFFVVALTIPNAFGENVPEWVKNTAGWWATDQIDDSSFLQGIQYLIKEGIIVIDSTETSESSGSQEVPSWIKNNAGWWAEGQIDDSSFISSMQWLISNGVIVVEEKLIHTDANLRVAFIGDQGLTANSIAVLELIKDERAELVLHQGDFDYSNDTNSWDRQISNVLGSDFPYFASIGHHDIKELNGYQEKLYDRLEKNPDATCNGELGIKSSCNYKGLFFILAAPGIAGSDHDSFIEKQLNNNDFMWRICSWHNDIHVMQKEAEPNKTGWEVYEACKNGGAIIANGHAHSYIRTKTLMYVENQIVNPEWPEPDKLTVKEGDTFIFISGLAGHSLAVQNYCFPASYPYGCDELATVYTVDQNANYGALFCTFNVNGQSNKADCYFKNIDGKIIDEFTITNFVGIDDDDNRPEIDLSENDLSGEDLTGTILVGVDLSGMDLTGTILTGANLSNSNLTGVDLSDKDLTGTILKGANLAYADMTGTILKGANFANSDLTGVDLSDKDLTGTILNRANLVNTKLTGTILKEANLSNSNLTGADLTGADLTETFLRGANLDHTILPDVGLSGKNFKYASFIGVDLSGKDLSTSDFSNSKLDNANLENANLSASSFVGIDLTKIKNKSLVGADLGGTAFSYSNLSGVNLAGTILKRTNFYNSNLSGQDFTVRSEAPTQGLIFMEANLSDSNFEGINLSPEEIFVVPLIDKAYLKNLSSNDLLAKFFDTIHPNIHIISTEVSGNDLVVKFVSFNNFSSANLENANFKNAGLMFVDFYTANLTNADLSGVDLRKSLLVNADLSNANLQDADISGVDLSGANLTGANLTGANLTGANLTGAILDCIGHTICVN
tara:strand:- start:74 stop:2641 length:2568 start_codon:yes stop_codon:yes gene_type:complete